jgi:hypothetical protein
MTNFRFARPAASALCVAMMMVAAPAFASHRAGSPDASGTQKLEAHDDGKGHVTYCAVLPAVTGTIMNSTKVCKTVAQWKADGVNIPSQPTETASNTGN